MQSYLANPSACCKMQSYLANQSAFDIECVSEVRWGHVTLTHLDSDQAVCQELC